MILLAVNPFGRRETHTAGEITTYKIFSVLTWALSVAASVYYTVHQPHHGHGHHHIRRRIWDINYLYPSAFTMNSVLGSIFWYATNTHAHERTHARITYLRRRWPPDQVPFR